jgi:hypothetical protein
VTKQAYQPGDRVWFKLLGRVVDAHPDVSTITVDDDGRLRVIDLDATDVELQAPAGWPPKLEDTWRIGDRRWFVIANGSAIALIDKDGNRMSAAEAATRTRDLILVSREQQDGGDRD